jgi:environmental stress-induced protein Ves
VRDPETGKAAGICRVLAEAGLDDLNRYTRAMGVQAGGVRDAARAVAEELAARALPPLAYGADGRVVNLQARAVEAGLDDYNAYLRRMGVKAGGALDAARAVEAELAARALPPLAYGADGRVVNLQARAVQVGLDDYNAYLRCLGVVAGGVRDAARAVAEELAARALPPLAYGADGRVMNLQARAVQVGLDDYNAYLRRLGVVAGGVQDAARAVEAELAARALPPLAYGADGRVVNLQKRAVEVRLEYSCAYLRDLTVSNLRYAEERIAFLAAMNSEMGRLEFRVDFTQESIAADAHAFLAVAVPGLIDSSKPYLVQVYYAGAHRTEEETARQLRYPHVTEYLSLPSATDALRAYGWRSHHVEQHGAEYALALEAAVQRIIIDAGVAMRPIYPGNASARLFSNAGCGWGGENVVMGRCCEYSCPSLTLPQ